MEKYFTGGEKLKLSLRKTMSKTSKEAYNEIERKSLIQRLVAVAKRLWAELGPDYEDEKVLVFEPDTKEANMWKEASDSISDRENKFLRNNTRGFKTTVKVQPEIGGKKMYNKQPEIGTKGREREE